MGKGNHITISPGGNAFFNSILVAASPRCDACNESLQPMKAEQVTTFAARTSRQGEPPASCETPPTNVLQGLVSPQELLSTAEEGAPWLWQGYLGPGLVTLLTSQWKSGKTTLVSVLLAHLQQGGLLAGLAVAPPPDYG